jgi:hypothetical protein
VDRGRNGLKTGSGLRITEQGILGSSRGKHVLRSEDKISYFKVILPLVWRCCPRKKCLLVGLCVWSKPTYAVIRSAPGLDRGGSATVKEPPATEVLKPSIGRDKSLRLVGCISMNWHHAQPEHKSRNGISSRKSRTKSTAQINTRNHDEQIEEARRERPSFQPENAAWKSLRTPNKK